MKKRDWNTESNCGLVYAGMALGYLFSAWKPFNGGSLSVFIGFAIYQLIRSAWLRSKILTNPNQMPN